jgi:hypothetical protein
VSAAPIIKMHARTFSWWSFEHWRNK